MSERNEITLPANSPNKASIALEEGRFDIHSSCGFPECTLLYKTRFDAGPIFA